MASKVQAEFGQPGHYNATPPTLSDGDAAGFQFDVNGNLKAVIATGDIEIGAVEIKNGSDDTRLSVIADNAAGGTPNGAVVAGQYNSSAPTYTSGDVAVQQMDVNGNTKTTNGSLGAGEDLVNDATKVRNRTGWSVVHSPAANTVATASKAAGAAGVKHVARGIIVSCSAGASAPTAIQLTWNLRDGASGAGTVLASGVIGITAVAGASPAPIQLSNLWLEGTAATAMTLEFTAAGGANTIEAVTLIGEDIS